MKNLNRTIRLGCLARIPHSIGVLEAGVERSGRRESEPSVVFERMARECVSSWAIVLV